METAVIESLQLELVFRFDISIGFNLPDTCLCRVTIGLSARVQAPRPPQKKSSSLGEPEKRILTDSK